MKNTKRLISLLSLSLVSLSFFGCSTMTSQRHMAGYESAVTKEKDVFIFPAEVYVETVDYFGSKKLISKYKMHDYEDHLGKVIDHEIVDAMQEKGLRVKKFTSKDIQDKNIKEVVAQLRDRYDSKRAALYKERLWDEKKAFDVTENIGTIDFFLGKSLKNDLLENSLLVFVNFAATAKTRGSQNIELIKNISPRPLSVRTSDMIDLPHDPSISPIDYSPDEEAQMIIGIIDAKTGNILWSHQQISNAIGINHGLETFKRNSTANSTEIKNLILAILKPLNIKAKQ